MAKDGHHLGVKNLQFFRAKEVSVTFDRIVPTQVDGEDLTGDSFRISMAPGALRILAPEGWQGNSAFNPHPATYPDRTQGAGKYIDVPASGGFRPTGKCGWRCCCGLEWSHGQWVQRRGQILRRAWQAASCFAGPGQSRCCNPCDRSGPPEAR